MRTASNFPATAMAPARRPRQRLNRRSERQLVILFGWHRHGWGCCIWVLIVMEEVGPWLATPPPPNRLRTGFAG